MRNGTSWASGRNAGLRTCILLALALVALAAVVIALSSAEQAQGAGTKDISFYFHNDTTSKEIGDTATLRWMDTLQGVDGTEKTNPTSNSVKINFYLYPALANATTIEGTISVQMWATRTVKMGDADQATLIFDLYDVDERGVTRAKITRGLITLSMVQEWRMYTATNSSVGRYTVDEGHFLLLEYELQGSSSNWYELAYGDSSFRSKLVVETHDYLLVDRAELQDAYGIATTVLEHDVVDKSVTFRAEVVDPFGGYDVKWVNATLVGPLGVRYLDDVAMTKVMGYFTSYRSAFEVGWDYTGMPEGTYTLVVSAVDNSGFYYRFPAHPDDDTYGGHIELLAITFKVGGPPQPVTVTVRDNLTLPLDGALVVAPRHSAVSNATGEAVLMLCNGSYAIAVLWQDVLVFEADVTVKGPTALTADCAVYHPAFLVLDDLGAPVSDAVALVGHPNGTLLKALARSDATGSFKLERMPVGEYGMSLLWLGTEVHSSRLDVDSNGPYDLVCAVYTLDIRVVDDLGDPVELAQVVVTNTTSGIVVDSRLTDLGGNTSSRLPVGSFDFSVYWRGQLVHDATRDRLVNASGPLVLGIEVYVLNVSAVDASGIPLASARIVVSLSSTSQVLEVVLTDDDGALSLRLAVGEYDIEAYWRGVLVNATEDLAVTDHADLVIVGDVFWVEVLVVDSRDVPLPGAVVSLLMLPDQSFGAKATGPLGTTTFRLPVGDYGATVAWLGTVVNETMVSIDSGEPLVIVAAVHYIDLYLDDSLGEPLEGAVVIAVHGQTGAVLASGLTDADGLLTLRLPAAPIELSAEWMGSPVLDLSLDLVADVELPLAAAVYLPVLHAVDSMGLDLEDAHVLLANSTTGRPMGDRVTDVAGEAPFRLPLGSYDVRVLWQGHVVMEGTIVVDDNDAIGLPCSVHHIAFHLTDSTGADLEDAFVSLVDVTGRPMGDRVSDASGEAAFRLPQATYLVRVLWKDHTVLDGPVVVSSNGVMALPCAVHHVSFHLKDSAGVDVGDAHISIVAAGGRAMGELVTGGDGTAALRLPAGAFQVSVSWRDVPVLATDVTVDSTVVLDYEVAVHYATLHAVDSRTVDVTDAQVSVALLPDGVAMGTAITGANGTVVLRLPAGDYLTLVRWHDTVVLEAVVTVDATETTDLATWVRYVNLHVVDSAGVDLALAHVRATNATTGLLLGSGTTASLGSVELRLPTGPLALDVTWESVLVNSTTGLTVAGDATVDVLARVHYLTVEAIDSEGSALRGAVIDVLAGGASVASARTGADGACVFRLPWGVYTVNLTYRTTYHMTRIDVARTQEVSLEGPVTVTFELKDTEYPIPFTRTNTFYTILGVVAVVVVFILLLYLVARRGAARAAPAATAEGEDALELELLDDAEESPAQKKSLTDQVGEGEIEEEEE